MNALDRRDLLNRRDVLRAGAWSVPVIAAAIATPLTAVSQPVETRSRIGFTNLSAYQVGSANSLGANTKVMVLDGEPVTGLHVTIVFTQGDKTFTDAHLFTEGTLPGWGSTNQLRTVQGGFTKDKPIDVFFTATAVGVETITGHVQVEAPRWWS